MSLTNDIPTNLRVPSQYPLDAKLYALSEFQLQSLGINNNLAYTYYKGMRVYCANERTIWEWRQPNNPGETGLLPSHFVYPTGLIVNDIDYGNQEYNFFPVLQASDIVIPTIPVYSVSNVGDGAGVYKDTTSFTFNLKSLKFESVGTGISPIKDVLVGPDTITFRIKKSVSDSLEITEDGDNIRYEIPSTFQDIDYYVNSNYTGVEELGTASKPFKELKRCMDIILNRAYQDTTTFAWIESPNPSINGGNIYEKWDLRSGLANGAVRVIIQSYTETQENIAINRVEYFLERGRFESMINVPSTGTGANLEYILDMKELVDNVPKVSGQLPYELKCAITGKGSLAFYGTHTQRKGFVRAYGYNNGIISLEQPDSNLYFGSVGGYITCLMYKNPNLTYVPLYSDAGNTVPIVRENVHMTGYQTSSVPDYGAIQVEGSNAIFRDSLYLSGTFEVTCFEQHLFYAKDYGTAYSDNGRIYIKRNYQHVNYSEIEYIDVNPSTPNIKKYYKPSTHIYDFYLKNGAIFSYAGDIYSQENTGYIQGGSESFVCLENATTDANLFCSFSVNGGGKVHSLYYNHYIKSILNPVFRDYQHHSIALKNLKITSNPFEEVISVVDTSDNDWTKIVTIGNFVDTFFQDYLVYGLIRLPFSNLTVNDKLFIIGTTIDLYKGMLNSNLPKYPNNAAALADGYPVSGFYSDNLGNLKVVI